MAIKNLNIRKNALRGVLIGATTLTLSGCYDVSVERSGNSINVVDSDMNTESNVVYNEENIDNNECVYDDESIENCRIVTVYNKFDYSSKNYIVEVYGRRGHWNIIDAITGDQLLKYTSDFFADVVYSYGGAWSNFDDACEIIDYGYASDYIPYEVFLLKGKYTRKSMYEILKNFEDNVPDEVKRANNEMILKKDKQWIFDHASEGKAR